MAMKVAYLCLQATKEGQASYAHVHEIINGLRRRGADVDLFEPAYAGHSALPGALGRFWEFIAVNLRVIAKIRRYDALYVRIHFGLWPSVMAAHLAGIPKAYEFNGPHEDLFIAWPATRRFAGLFKWLHRSQARRCEALITVTDELGTWLRGEYPGSNVFVIPNGANTDLFTPDAKPAVELPPRFALFFGAMTAWQGLDMVMEAVNRPEWPQGLDLVVVGDGVMRPLVEEEAARNPRVRYLGPMPYSKMPGIAAAATISLVPCGNPGGRASTGLFPLKLFESMAAGTPVVVTDFPGQAKLVRETGCGVVVPYDDAEALAKAVAHLMADLDATRAMGVKGREAAVQQHSWDKRAADTFQVLENTLVRKVKG